MSFVTLGGGGAQFGVPVKVEGANTSISFQINLPLYHFLSLIVMVLRDMPSTKYINGMMLKKYAL